MKRKDLLLLVLSLSACIPVVLSHQLTHGYEQVSERKLIQNSDQHSSSGFAPASCEDVFSMFPKARESQSCSIGATKGFIGPLSTWLDVKDMLQARSYKGEVREKPPLSDFRNHQLSLRHINRQARCYTI
jgi:hypothetical protein